jgi:hypothetical protein
MLLQVRSIWILAAAENSDAVVLLAKKSHPSETDEEAYSKHYVGSHVNEVKSAVREYSTS